MNWTTKKIGEVCNVVPGFAFKSKDLGDSGIPVIKIANITDNYSVDTKSTQCFPSEFLSERYEKFTLGNGDILIAMTGATAGKVGRIRCSEDQSFLLNQRVAKFEPKDIHPDFFWNVISTPRYRTVFFGLGGGAAQPNMSGSQIESVEVPFPPFPVQERIASILSAYDDLIENNRRRIQLLEQSAQMLYKEWFIHLRFPGHEHVKIKDGVPEGWQRKQLGEVAPLKYGKALKQDSRIPGVYPVYGSSGCVDTHIKAMVEGPTIIVGRKGNIGSVYWSYKDCNPIDTVYYIAKENSSLRLYYSLQHISFISTDVAVPGLNRDFAHSRQILIPDSKIDQLFESTVDPIHRQIETLQKQNDSLAQARDLLLPRLMNGEIAV